MRLKRLHTQQGREHGTRVGAPPPRTPEQTLREYEERQAQFIIDIQRGTASMWAEGRDVRPATPRRRPPRWRLVDNDAGFLTGI